MYEVRSTCVMLTLSRDTSEVVEYTLKLAQPLPAQRTHEEVAKVDARILLTYSLLPCLGTAAMKD